MTSELVLASQQGANQNVAVEHVTSELVLTSQQGANQTSKRKHTTEERNNIRFHIRRARTHNQSL